MKRSDIGAGAVLALVMAWVLLWLIPTQTSPAQSETTMSPAMMPSIAAGLVLVLSLALLAGRVLFAATDGDEPHEEFGGETRGFGKGDAIEIAIWTTAAIVTLALMTHVSFIVASAVVLVAAMWWMGQRTIWALAAVALGVPVGISLVARYLFGVEMP